MNKTVSPTSRGEKDEAEMAAAAFMEAEGRAWVAPEVLDGDEYTAQSDLFSYGGVLFEVRDEFVQSQCLDWKAERGGGKGKGGRRAQRVVTRFFLCST